jgi:deoxyribonuclease IV
MLLIGAHTSTSGGLHNALIEGKNIGATTVQLFTSNQRQWSPRILKPEDIDLWHSTLEETGLHSIMSHDSYLINLGAPNPEVLVKSRKAFREELMRCHALNIAFLNFHPGSAIKDPPEQCIDRIVESILEIADLAAAGDTRLLIETTAGQGSNIGYSFEQVAKIISRTEQHLSMGVCLDTCHSFAAGYDIPHPDIWVAEFDKIIGIQHLHAFHVNDSKHPQHSRRDRHASLGEGYLGIDAFKALMQHPKTRNIPKYLETPGGPNVWDKEIKLLRKFYEENNA